MTNRSSSFLQIVGLIVTCCLALSAAALAADNPSYTQIGRNITIGPNDKVGDVTCLACNIRVRGQVIRDVTVVGGSIEIEDGGQVGGDLTSVAGSIRLDQTAKITGDVTAVGGNLHRDPQASVGGDVTALSGRGWLALIVVVPLIFLGLLVAFVIWGIRRISRPAPTTAVARG